ncbi:zinc finger protein 177-like [Frankliniella occidentalis]|uniref:Zinc finger protein 177-like n=1 Tax=Frankliniella occidentalis TaxID=133901 RepID=A0A9C6XT46_FRAOC|nr:zinc finger protein 177-like [Frankliniella occidentalis]
MPSRRRGAGPSSPSSSAASLFEDPAEVSVVEGLELDELKREHDDQLGLVMTACFSLQDKQCPVEDTAKGGPGDGEMQPEQSIEEVASSLGDATRQGDSTIDAQLVQINRLDAEKAPRVLRKKRLDKKYTKSGCESKTNTSGALQANSAELNNGAFKCEVCGKSFTRTSHLKRHRLYHTGEKPFSCDLCHSRFTEKGHLVVHLRTHTGEKPYTCDMCNKAFIKKSGLNRHKTICISIKRTLF